MAYPPAAAPNALPDTPPLRQRAQPPLLPSRTAQSGHASSVPSTKLPVVETDILEDDGWGLDVIGYWAVGCAIWLASLSLPLLLFPRILLFFSQTSSSPSSYSAFSAKKASDDHFNDLSNLERYLCQQMGVGVLAVAGMALLLTPIPIPTPSFPPLQPHSSLPASIPSTSSGKHIRMGFLLILSGMMGLSGLTSWNNRALSSAGLFTMISIGNTIFSLWGFWVFAFGLGDVYRSKKTGADKRTSQFPFYNKNAASVQKKEWRKHQ